MRDPSSAALPDVFSLLKVSFGGTSEHKVMSQIVILDNINKIDLITAVLDR